MKVINISHLVNEEDNTLTLEISNNQTGEVKVDWHDLPASENYHLVTGDNTNLEIYQELTWKKEYSNPIELAEIVGVFLDNMEDYLIHMWVCLDKNVYININEQNGNEIIKYLYERFPY